MCALSMCKRNSKLWGLFDINLYPSYFYCPRESLHKNRWPRKPNRTFPLVNIQPQCHAASQVVDRFINVLSFPTQVGSNLRKLRVANLPARLTRDCIIPVIYSVDVFPTRRHFRVSWHIGCLFPPVSSRMSTAVQFPLSGPTISKCKPINYWWYRQSVRLV